VCEIQYYVRSASSCCLQASTPAAAATKAPQGLLPGFAATTTCPLIPSSMPTVVVLVAYMVVPHDKSVWVAAGPLVPERHLQGSHQEQRSGNTAFSDSCCRPLDCQRRCVLRKIRIKDRDMSRLLTVSSSLEMKTANRSVLSCCCASCLSRK
jgi:hypothetical protein